MAAILSGARKYGLGLTLAHQDMRQLRSRSEDVASAVLANALTRVVFRVSDQDARVLAEGFSVFEARDLQNLGVGEAIARIERSESDFNLRTQPVLSVQKTLAATRREAVRSASRSHYATPRTTIAERLEEDRNSDQPSFAEVTSSRRPRRAGTAAAPREPLETTPPGRGGQRHKYLQSLVKRIGEDHGFRATIEKVVLDGHGHIDVALERGDLAIACEMSISTRADHEIQNLTKCLASGFDRGVLICSELRTLSAAREAFVGMVDRVAFVIPEELGAHLDEIARASTPKLRPFPTRTLKQGDGAITTGREIADTAPSHSEAARRHILIARDAAAYLGLATQTLAKQRWAGTSPPFYKIGRHVMYDRADLDAWLAVRRRQSTSEGSGTGD